METLASVRNPEYFTNSRPLNYVPRCAAFSYKPRIEVFHLNRVLHGDFGNVNAHDAVFFAKFVDPISSAYGGKPESNSLKKCFCRHVNGVRDVFHIIYGDAARANHLARLAYSLFVRHTWNPRSIKQRSVCPLREAIRARVQDLVRLALILP